MQNQLNKQKLTLPEIMQKLNVVRVLLLQHSSSLDFEILLILLVVLTFLIVLKIKSRILSNKKRANFFEVISLFLEIKFLNCIVKIHEPSLYTLFSMSKFFDNSSQLKLSKDSVVKNVSNPFNIEITVLDNSLMKLASHLLFGETL